ncbi:MAG: choice-of-anchor D domain-containing protein [Vicinamibacterales bacterium]
MSRATAFLFVCLSLFVSACSKDSSSPTSPSPPAAATRVIALIGSLAFGDVPVGSQRDLTFTITNTGTSALTVTGLSVSGGLASQLLASWTDGQVPAGGAQPVTLRFAPSASGRSGTLTVNADHTGGSNTLPISASASGGFGGTWVGSYVVERCDGTGSVQDVFCSQNRGLFPAGSTLPIAMSLTQDGASVAGSFSLGQVTGSATGTVNAAGVLTLQGSAASGTLSITLTSWASRINGSSMEGNFGYNVTAVGVGGVAAVSTRLSGVTRR